MLCHLSRGTSPRVLRGQTPTIQLLQRASRHRVAQATRRCIAQVAADGASGNSPANQASLRKRRDRGSRWSSGGTCSVYSTAPEASSSSSSSSNPFAAYPAPDTNKRSSSNACSAYNPSRVLNISTASSSSRSMQSTGWKQPCCPGTPSKRSVVAFGGTMTISVLMPIFRKEITPLLKWAVQEVNGASGSSQVLIHEGHVEAVLTVLLIAVPLLLGYFDWQSQNSQSAGLESDDSSSSAITDEGVGHAAAAGAGSAMVAALALNSMEQRLASTERLLQGMQQRVESAEAELLQLRAARARPLMTRAAQVRRV